MDLISILINELSAKKEITPLEKDILDTWNELNKNPFDEKTAKKQVDSNDINHPDIFLAIAEMPTTVQMPKTYQPTEYDIKYNLQNQLILLAKKEQEVQRHSK